jgi:ferredoxin
MQKNNRIRRNMPRGRRRDIRTGSLWPGITVPESSNRENELMILKQRIQLISQKLERIKKRIEIKELKPGGKIVAVVDEEECAGCGICYDVCPQGAISMYITEKIDSSKCTACLECVNRCPRGAIAIKYQDW